MESVSSCAYTLVDHAALLRARWRIALLVLEGVLLVRRDKWLKARTSKISLRRELRMKAVAKMIWLHHLVTLHLIHHHQLVVVVGHHLLIEIRILSSESAGRSATIFVTWHAVRDFEVSEEVLRVCLLIGIQLSSLLLVLKYSIKKQIGINMKLYLLKLLGDIRHLSSLNAQCLGQWRTWASALPLLIGFGTFCIIYRIILIICADF